MMYLIITLIAVAIIGMMMTNKHEMETANPASPMNGLTTDGVPVTPPSAVPALNGAAPGTPAANIPVENGDVPTGATVTDEDPNAAEDADNTTDMGEEDDTAAQPAPGTPTRP